MDWGYARPFAVYWAAVDEERRMYLIREYYGCTGTPNQGVKLKQYHRTHMPLGPGEGAG